MSTDVYLDFFDSASGEKQVMSTRRIGHLFMLGQYGMGGNVAGDLLDALRVLCVASAGVVQPWVPEAAKLLCEAYEEALEDYNEQGHRDWSRENFLANKPGVDYDDRPTPEELFTEFNEHIGCNWDTRVD